MKVRTVLLTGISLLAMTAHAHALEALGSLIITAFMSVGAAGLLPAASAAAIGLSAIGVAVTAANLAFSLFNRHRSNPQEIKQTSKGSEGPGRHAFGRVDLAGKIGFGNTAGYDIYRLLFQCFGPIDGVEDFKYDGVSVTVEEDGKVSSPPWTRPGGDSYLQILTRAGDGDDLAFADLVSAFPALVTSNHRARGIASLLLKFRNPGTGHGKFATLFQGGIKEAKITARVGSFYDPRTETSSWTMNGALICLHYFRRMPGMRDEYIDFDDLAAFAIPQAEELVTTKDGTAPRCQLSGGWEGPITSDVVRDMLESAGLEPRKTRAGRWTFRFLEDDPESEATFYARHIIDSLPQAGPEGVKRPNICRVRYLCPERSFELAEIPLHTRDPETNEYLGAHWARVPAEIERYGEQELQIDLVFCCDASQAQRLGRRLFHMARADFGLSRLNFAWRAAWGRKTVTLELPDLGEDGGSLMVKVRKQTVRVDDQSGTGEFPWQAIPPELQVPWNAATMEMDPPPPLPRQVAQGELPRSKTPSEYALVQYPDDSFELRLRFEAKAAEDDAPIPGASIAEAAYQLSAGSVSDPWRSMTEQHELVGNQWFAYASVTPDPEGKNGDFRARFFNTQDESSIWSENLEARPIAIDNTAPAAPSLTYDEDTGLGEVSVSVINAARVTVEKGPFWVEVLLDAAIRPNQVLTFDPNLPPPIFDTPQNIEYRARAYASDGTPGDYATLNIGVPAG